MTDLIALIPARAGSKRIKNKNIRILNGHPLIAYTIITAIQAGIFTQVVVSTEDQKIAEISKYYGATVPFLRPEEFAQDTSPDIDWVKYTLSKLNYGHNKYFSILRPTSPFRTIDMLRKAWKLMLDDQKADSIRAVEKCSQHPAKMWYLQNKRMVPVIKNLDENQIEWYSTPIQVLPEIYSQNSSLEIAKSQIPLETNSIAGEQIIPYITKDYEGYDLNTEKDWIFAEYLLSKLKVKLPELKKPKYNL